MLFPFCLDVLLLIKALGLFECLPQDDLELRINRGLRPHAFEKGKGCINSRAGMLKFPGLHSEAM